MKTFQFQYLGWTTYFQFWLQWCWTLAPDSDHYVLCKSSFLAFQSETRIKFFIASHLGTFIEKRIYWFTYLLSCTRTTEKVSYVSYIFLGVKSVAYEVIRSEQNLAGVFEWSLETKNYPRHRRPCPMLFLFSHVDCIDSVSLIIHFVVIFSISYEKENTKSCRNSFDYGWNPREIQF